MQFLVDGFLRNGDMTDTLRYVTKQYQYEDPDFGNK